MRSAFVVSAATAAALVASAVPAQAALPYCALVLAPTANRASCTTAFPDENGLILRNLTFHVETGLVTGTVTCAWNSESVTVAAPFTGSITIHQPRDESCTHTLVARVPSSTAAGVSTYTVTWV